MTTRDKRDVYKDGVERGRRTVARATRNTSDLMGGVASAVADGAKAFGESMRKDDPDNSGRMSPPESLAEAGALAAARMFEGMAGAWNAFYEALRRDHDAERDRDPPPPPPAAAVPEIDYERLAELVAAKLRPKV